MSIFVRPVREQLEHDRLIRFLQPKYKRRFEVVINPGDEQTAPVKIGTGVFYPDLVLTDGKRLGGIIEIETGESINNLEAMYQWGPFSKARVPFHLYVPVQGYDAAKRLIDANRAKVAEVWTYRGVSEGFDLVRMSVDPTAVQIKPPTTSAAKPEPKAAVKKPVAAARTPAPKPAAKKPVKLPVKAKPKPKAKPAAKPKSKATSGKPSQAAKAKPKKPAGRRK